MTKYKSGAPYDLTDLVNGFQFRLETLSDFAESIEARKDSSHEAKALAKAIVSLRDDFECFEEALIASDVRRHPEDWTEDTRRRYGVAEVGR